MSSFEKQWTIIRTEKLSAQDNMAIDADLLDRLSLEHTDEAISPILHLYAWEAPSVTYGHFIDPYRFIKPDVSKRLGLQLAKRPTGGGMIFHVTDLAFSMVIPATHPGYSVNVLDNYAFVNRLVIQAIERFISHQATPHLLAHDPQPLTPTCQHFCMAKPTKYDVMLEGRKVGGGAQRRTKYGFLHQGSIALSLPSIDFLKDVLLADPNLIEAMQTNTYALLPGYSSSKDLIFAREKMSQILIDIVNE